MSQTVQYRLDQVAKALELSEGVVHRLSNIFGLPKRLVHSQVRTTGYTLEEVQQLRQIQQWLRAGNTIEEIRARLRAAEKSILPGQTVRFATMAAAASPPSEPTLVEYTEEASMKRELADVSFRQYRQNNQLAAAPFESLSKKLEGSRNRATLQRLNVGLKEASSASAVFSETAPTRFVETSMTLSDWLSKDFRTRLLKSQHGLTTQRNSTNRD